MAAAGDWEAHVLANPRLITYQLDIHLSRKQRIAVGRLGTFEFPAGHYRYTGSARCNLTARVRRHLAKTKKLRWHIDYLLAAPHASVTGVKLFAQPECAVNQQIPGEIIVPGFGASDCRARCGSHLKLIDSL